MWHVVLAVHVSAFCSTYCVSVLPLVKEPIQMPVKICMQRAKSTFPKLKPSEELQKVARAMGTKTTTHTHTHTESKSKGNKGEKKRAETFPNSTVTLMPRLLSILDSSTSNRSPGWRLLTSGLLALKVSVTVLGETPCKQRRAG